jgi:hypothetical protein
MGIKKEFLIIMFAIVISGLLILNTGCSKKNAETSSQIVNATTSSSDAQQKDILNNKIFSLYNKVNIGDKKSEVESKLGATGNEAAQNSFVYVDLDTGYAVNVFYTKGDLVSLKVLIPTKNSTDLIELSKASVTSLQVSEIEQGMTLNEVKNKLSGIGIEMLRMSYPGNNENEVYGLAWINKDGSVLVVTFDGSNNTVLKAEFKKALL